MGERAEDGQSTPAHAPVGLDEVDRRTEALDRYLGETCVRRLIRLVRDPVAEPGTQVLDAAAAEAALAVPDQERDGNGAGREAASPSRRRTLP